MNKSTILCILFITMIASSNAEECQKFSCSEINAPNTCSLPGVGTTKFQLCNNNNYCSFNIEEDATKATCSKGKPYKVPRYPGMDCDTDSDCVRNKCVNKKCKEVKRGEECKTAFECAYGLTCIDKKCVSPKGAGESCKVDYDCVRSSGCKDGICTEYFSLVDGTPSSYVNVHEKGLSLCSSGYSSEFGECQTLKLKNPTEPCSDESPCTYTNGINEFVEPTNCLCGLNSKGNRYCKLGSGDQKFKDYIKNLKDYNKNSDNCHITERGEGACAKDLLSNDKEIIKIVKKLEKSKLEALYNPQIYNADECVKRLLYPDVYDGSDRIEKCAAYECSSDEENYCAKSKIDDDKLIITLYTKTCKSSEYCDFEKGVENYFYEKTKKTSKCYPKKLSYLKYPGEACNDEDECKIISNSNQSFGKCTKNKCFGYEKKEKCSSSIECMAGNYCDNSICVEQKKEDQDCTKTEECQNNLLCYKGKCKDVLYNFTAGTDVSGLENPELYCEYGTVLNNKCVEVKEKNSASEFKECDFGEDCQYETTTGEEFTKKCGCGFNSEGKGYCPKVHDYNKNKWKEYFKLKKESYNNECHSLNRYNCHTNKESEINKLKVELIDAHLYYHSVDCSKAVIGGI